jgi:hypothetical protein
MMALTVEFRTRRNVVAKVAARKVTQFGPQNTIRVRAGSWVAITIERKQPPITLSKRGRCPSASSKPPRTYLPHTRQKTLLILGLQRPAARLGAGDKFICPKSDVASLYIRSPQSAVKWFGFFGQRSEFFGQPFMDLCFGIEMRASDELMPCTRAKTSNPCSSRRECAFGTPRDRGMRVP